MRRTLCVGAVRVVLGAALLLLTVRLAGSPAVRLARGPLAVGGLGVAGYRLCFFAAVHTTGVAVGTVVALGSAPVFAGLGGWLVDRTRPGRAWALATALAGGGVALTALGSSAAKVSVPGVVLALGAGASYAVFTLASKRLLDAGAGVDRIMAGLFALGAFLLVPVLAVGDLDWLATAGGVVMALWLAAVPTALAYILFGHGLRLLPASEVTTLTLAEPITAVSLGATVLGECPGALAAAGIALLIVGLAVLTPLRPSWPCAEDTVVVIGGGAVGIAAALGLRAVVPADAPSNVELAVECGGYEATVQAAIAATRPGGTVVCVGLAAPEVRVPMVPLVIKERRLLGSSAYTLEDFRAVAAALRDDGVDLAPMIERRVTLAELPGAFEDYTSGRETAVKTLMTEGA